MLEIEADAVARRIDDQSPLGADASGYALHRDTGSPSADVDAPESVDEVLAAPGEPLAAGVVAAMTSRFEHDFSGVRVHVNPAAAASAADMSALAYTVGQHVVFGSGRYAPETSAGRRLLAHELAHVVQQDGTGPTTVRRHTTSDCGATQTSLVASAVLHAQKTIGAAASPLTVSPLSADVQNALWLYFRDSSPATASTVATNLQSISTRLSGLSFECESDCAANMLGYTRLGTVLTGIGNIHLCTNNLGATAADYADTIIHEAAHFVLNVSDAGGYFGGDCSESEDTVAAGQRTRVGSADSYNCFVANWARGSASDRANAKGDLQGSNILGIEQVPAGPIDLQAASPRRPLFIMKLTRGPIATVTGVSYRWILRDTQDRSYKLTDTSGAELFEFNPAVESVLAMINTPTRNLLRQRNITSARVICHATSPVFGDKLFEVPVTFATPSAAP
jgi:hypothetical protein